MTLLYSRKDLASTSIVYFMLVFSKCNTKVLTDFCGSKVCNETYQCLDEGCKRVCVEAPSMCELHTASKNGDLSRVKFLLSQGRVDINCQEWIGRTPVMWAASGGHREVVEVLVNKGANVSLVDRFGINILHSASLGGDVEVVKYVLSQHTVNINDRVGCGRTALMLAAENGQKDVVELLVDKEANMSLVDATGDNILHCASRGGDLEVVEYILLQGIVDINSLGRHKKTPVMLAGEEGHKEVVELLVKNEANLSLTDEDGNNILHLASYRGSAVLDVVKYLVSLNSLDINSRGWSKRTPVMIAAESGYKEMVELLVKRGANLLLCDKHGDNTFHRACVGGHFDVVNYVLSLNSVDINIRGWKKRTPVMIAAETGHKEVVALLVKRGSHLLLCDKHGDNILHYACVGGHFDVLKYILSMNSVDINSRGWKKRTPVMTAAGQGHNTLVDFLVKHEANLSFSDDDGNNILHLASRKGRVEVVKYVLSLNSVDINSRGWKKRTSVMLAAGQGYKKVVELLVKHGTDLSGEKGVDTLHNACYRGQFDVVKYVRSLNSVDIKSRGWKKRIPVMVAARQGHKTLVDFLVKHEANLSLSDDDGNNILHLASYKGRVEVVKYVLSLDSVDINIRGWEKRTPVMLAAETGHKEVVALLVKRGANLLLCDKHGDNTLHRACVGGHFDVVSYVLSLNTVDINIRGWKKRTPVMIAAETGHKEVVALLVKRGANLLLCDKHGDNTLHRACVGGHFDVVSYVLSLNTVDINIRGWKKRTPVMIAAENGHKQVVALLVKRGANLLLCDKHGDNTLHRACVRGHFDVVSYVLSLNSMDINIRGWEKRTPVMIAAATGHKEVVALLVKRGANLSLWDKHGGNILHRACVGGHFDVVKYVLSLNSVDINIRGWKKRTPVMVAARRGHKNVVSLLVKYGANLSLRDEDNANILSLARHGGHFEVARYISSLSISNH